MSADAASIDIYVPGYRFEDAGYILEVELARGDL
jgi:hypothetical protein